MPTIFLSLGSNLGDRRENLRRAVEALREHYTQRAVSSLYETDPVGYADQPQFLNIVWQGETAEEPNVVFRWIKDLEQLLGRAPSFPNGPRAIDIDLLLYNQRVITKTDLEIPHPRMTERAFVLLPFAEIAPHTALPTGQKRISELARSVSGKEGVRKIEDAEWARVEQGTRSKGT